MAGARVTAIPAADTADENVLAGIAVTDDDGRYTLAELPPGRYRIAAGRVDAPVYYPGTVDIEAATIVTVRAGVGADGIHFALGTENLRPTGVPNRVFSQSFAALVPLEVRVQGGGKIPLSSAGKTVLLRAVPAGTTTLGGTPLTAATVDVRLFRRD